MKRFGRFSIAALAAVFVLAACSNHHSRRAPVEDGGEGGVGDDIVSMPFSVSGTWVNLVSGCNGGPVSTYDEIQMAFPSDTLTLEVVDGECHAVFSGLGVISNPATGATVEDASMSFDLELGVADCADAADIAIGDIMDEFFEMDVLAEDGAYPFECHGRRTHFLPVEVGTPVPITFTCPHLDSGCPSLITNGEFSAEFDIVTTIQDAASAS